MRLLRILVFALSLALVAVACGGDDAQAFCDRQAALEDVEPTDAEAADEIAALVEDAPEEIRDDIQTVAVALETVNAGEQPDTPPAEIQAAAQRVQDWVDENCEEG